MRTIDLILKKRDGEELSNSEIDWFVQSFTSGSIPDYQIAAMSMAIFFRGMNARETTDLTIAMAKSGDTLDLSDLIPGVVVDKHSTGGVGDKTTLVLAPIVSACGVVVAKISGRGLGHGGGTLDKLEAIPGLQIQLTSEQFRAQIKETGIVVAGQSSSLAPADGKLYKIRDVTGTVASNALIASSIMSKKFAAGAQAIVLDVKTGNGAFMTTLKDAQELAELMVAIGRNSGRKTVAVISDMNQPLGYAVGNALEVREAIETLRGDGPPDLREHCLKMAGYMLHLSGKVDSVSAGSELASNTLKDGTAFQELMKMVSAQGGDTKYVDNPEQLEKAKLISTVTSTQDGFLSRMDAINIGKAAVMLGAGREQKNDPIDLAVGIVVHQKVGSRINTGDPLFTIHANNPEKINSASEEALAGIDITIEKSPRLPLHYDFIE
ncbi:MAG: thymidine phosphorylase [Anaerolineaceae bacterium]|nr:thymidine phosphorylase [Anaerolineaceae bacterium]|tara:strand:- start:6088 stop:7395 length:1308 start_codon:yes stop_codon:yes gene_type:complete